ncbi:hypothetical protein PO909_002299 [Leuciscus waleckii]
MPLFKIIQYCLFCILSKLGAVNWSAFSRQYRQEFRVPYSLTLCLHCTEVYKDCPLSMWVMAEAESCWDFILRRRLRAIARLTVFFFRLSRLCVSVRTRVSVHAHKQIITYINRTHTHAYVYTQTDVYVHTHVHVYGRPKGPKRVKLSCNLLVRVNA